MTPWGPAHQDKLGRWQVWVRPGPRRRRGKRGHSDYEHRLIWIRHNGPIPKGMEVHHRNGRMSDNRIENLELLTRAEHNRRHKLGYNRTWKYAPGRPIRKNCIGCGKVKPLSHFQSNGYTQRGTPVVKPRCTVCMEKASQ